VTSRKAVDPALLLIALSHGVILFAGFFAPYAADTQNRELSFAPPTALHFWDLQGHFHFRPFIYRSAALAGQPNTYREDRSRIFPVHFLVPGTDYRLLGLFRAHRHLFGVDEPARLLLAGSDFYGRDELSRLLFGGQISLFSGVFAAGISLVLGMLLGGLAGYHGRWVDDLVMRIAEVFLAVPWLYLLLSARALLPLHVEPHGVFLLLMAVLGLVGWARPARLVRGVVLSCRKQDFVLAARGFGASDVYLIRAHIFPQAASIAATQMALYVPQYILAEVTLSFFGLGVSEPAPSWGNMLAPLQDNFTLQFCWWLLSPAAALILVFLAYRKAFAHYAKAQFHL